jgi:hypothetical protein
MHLIYNTTGGINGYDKFGHFLRASLIVTSCTTLVASPTPNGVCATRWGDQGASAKLAATPAAAKAAILERAKELGAQTPSSSTGGTPFDAQGDLAGASSSPAGSRGSNRPHAPSLRAARHLLDTVIGREGHVPDTGAPSGQYTTPNTQGGTAP